VQYVWVSTTGLSTLQSGSIAVSTSGSVTGNYSQRSVYTLTIETDGNGTTNPAPGTYTYAEGTTVQVTAIPNPSYVVDHWELNGTNMGSASQYSVLMNNNYRLKAFFKIVPQALSIHITPTSSTIQVNQSLQLMSTRTGGASPFHYQWYLDGNPVTGATSETWIFTPTHAGTYFVYLRVTDGGSNSAQSETARVEVLSVSTGGYSVSSVKQSPPLYLAAYTAVLALFGVGISLRKRKRI
jgi:hypothetical protein